MKVLLTRSDLAMGGPAITMLRLALALREQGILVEVAASGGEMIPAFKDEGFRYHHVEGLALDQRGLWTSLRASRQLARLAVTRDIDLLHSFNAHAALCAQWSKVRGRAATVHTVLGNGKERINRLHSASIVAVSNDTREVLEKVGVSAGRITVIPPLSINREYLCRATVMDARNLRSSERPIRFINVAVFLAGKGQDALIRHFAQYRARGGKGELQLVGDGPTRAACEELVVNLRVSQHVTFLGAQKNVRPFLDQADVFVHSASAETFGMVMVEAGARGLPVIASRVGGIVDIVVDGKTGLLPLPKYEGQFAQAMRLLEGDSDMRRRLGDAARDRVEQNFIAEKLVGQYQNVYKQARASL